MKAMKESQSIIVSGKFIPVCILLKSDLQFWALEMHNLSYFKLVSIVWYFLLPMYFLSSNSSVKSAH